MTSLHLQDRIDRLQAERAAQWLETLQGSRQEDMAAFAAWCRESPVHIREFLEASWVHQELGKLGTEESIEALLREVAPDVRLFPEVRASRDHFNARDGKKHWPIALAASALIAIVTSGVYLWHRDTHPKFTTHVGEQRTVELADASVVSLNTDSQIEVKFARDARNVELRHGEAVFKVARDESRPFRVRTRTAVVLAVGTQFNVYDRPDGTDVTVLEGRVRVTARGAAGSAQSYELEAGQEARIRLEGQVERVDQPDLQRVVAWSKRRLKFERASLEEIVSEFNRYNRVQLRIEGVAPGTHLYRGMFDADDPGSLADLLEHERDLVVERRAGAILIRPRVLDAEHPSKK